MLFGQLHKPPPPQRHPRVPHLFIRPDLLPKPPRQQFGQLLLLAVAQVQVLRDRRVRQQVDLPIPLQHRQVVQQPLDPILHRGQRLLRHTVARPILDELPVVLERCPQQPLARGLQVRLVDQLLLAHFNQHIDRRPRSLKLLLRLVRPQPLPIQCRDRPLLRPRHHRRRGHQPQHHHPQQHHRGCHHPRVPTRPLLHPIKQRGRPRQDRLMLQEPPHVRRQLRRRPVPLFRILRQRLQHNDLQLRRNVLVPPPQRSRVLMQNLVQQLRPRLPREHRLQRQQLVKRRPQGINVGPVVQHRPLPRGLLRTHVAERPQQIPRPRQPRLGLEHRQPKVGDPQVPLGIHHQVARLDVPVHHPQLMRMIQRVRRLDHQPRRLPEIARPARSRRHRPRRRPAPRRRRADPRHTPHRTPGHSGRCVGPLARLIRAPSSAPAPPFPRRCRQCHSRPLGRPRLRTGKCRRLGPAIPPRNPNTSAPLTVVPPTVPGLVPRQTRLLPQLANHHRQRLPLNQLHRIKMHPPIRPHRVDRHDMGVMQQRRRLGLVLKPLQLPGVKGRRERQHLQRHPPPQALLHRFINNPHPPPGNLPHNQKVAQGPRSHFRSPRPCRRQTGPRPRLRPGKSPPQQVQPVETLADHRFQLGIPPQVLFAHRPPPLLELGLILLHQLDHPRVVERLAPPGSARRTHRIETGWWIKGMGHSNSLSTIIRRRLARARTQSFCTLSTVFPIRVATSGKLSSSRFRKITTSR